ncbi:metalloprotease [Halobacteriaceae archaeon GCM10025711]
MKFSRKELQDLGVAWLALGLAFTFFYGGPRVVWSPSFTDLLLLSLVTVGVAFLLHELAHKVVAIHYDQVAEFRADYGMLGLAIAGGLAGFLFAAPGAVHHRGYLTDREHGLIALAGPVTNLGLAALFAPLLFVLPEVGLRGVQINLLLAAFNMLPFGPLDGNTVASWNKGVFLVVFLVSAALAAVVLLPFF